MTAWGARLVTACSLASAVAVAVPAAQIGSAELAGIVVTTGTPPAPLARVLVTLAGPALASSLTTITDDQGRFAFPHLPAGAFTLTAARPPYVRTAFGARRPGRPGTSIAVGPGQRVDGVTIPLVRGSVISGLVRAPTGEPAPAVDVRAVPLADQSGPSTVSVVTDDRGAYRIYGLTPGKYVVSADVSVPVTSGLTQVSDAQMDDILARLRRRSAGPSAAGAGTSPAGAALTAASGRPASTGGGGASYRYAPIYYPGTADADQAETIVLGEAEDRDGVNLDLQLVHSATVQGRAVVVVGAVPAGTDVVLVRVGWSAAPPGQLSPMTQLDASGVFQFADVPPGRYRVRAATDRRAASSLWAATEITIGSEDVTGLTLMLQPALRVSGRLVFESHTATSPPDPTTVRLALADVAAEGTGLPGQVRAGRGGSSAALTATAARANGRADGTFEIGGIAPGTYGMTALADEHWALRSIVIGGHDVSDGPFEIGSAGDVAGVVATFTDLRSELSGTLETATSTPAPEYVVVAFPSDRRLWRAPSRRVQSIRPADGRFAFRDLPAGDYLLAALTDVEPADLADTAFLEGLVPAAVAVHLGEGETKTQRLRISR